MIKIKSEDIKNLNTLELIFARDKDWDRFLGMVVFNEKTKYWGIMCNYLDHWKSNFYKTLEELVEKENCDFYIQKWDVHKFTKFYLFKKWLYRNITERLYKLLF